MCDCATPATWNQGGCHQVPRLPRRSGAASRASRAPKPRPSAPPATQCHEWSACHAKRPWMCDCATPATWNRSGAASRASRAPKPRPSAPPSTMSATPATQNDGGCAIVPRLPREIKVDVTKCHACHAEVARRHGRHGRLNQDQARHPVPWVKRLPRKTTVDVRLCHACHVKSRWMSPSATPATQKWRGVTGVTGA